MSDELFRMGPGSRKKFDGITKPTEPGTPANKTPIRITDKKEIPGDCHSVRFYKDGMPD